MKKKFGPTRFVTFSSIFATAAVLSACGVTVMNSKSGVKATISQKTSDNVTEKINPGSTVPATVDKSLTDSGAGFQVKNAAFLASSLESCLGSGLTEIKEDMLQVPPIPPPPALPDGKLRFLSAGSKYAAGKNILTVEGSNFPQEIRNSRAAVQADRLTDIYLMSLGVVADVVAHNCNLESAMCKCDTPVAAAEMVKRCLPSLKEKDPDTIAISTALAESCSGTDKSKKRASIAALIGSFAFAQSRN